MNIALGIRRLNQTKYEEALSYLQTAANKLNIQYYQPLEGELFYYMGLAQKALGDNEEAHKNFGRATWYYQWLSSANFEFAQLEIKNDDLGKALKHISAAYSNNYKDGRINVLYSALLRKSGKPEDALVLMNDLLTFDPLDFSALYEKSIIEGDASLRFYQQNMLDVENNYLEVATRYMNVGLYVEGSSLLSEIKNPANPLPPPYTISAKYDIKNLLSDSIYLDLGFVHPVTGPDIKKLDKQRSLYNFTYQIPGYYKIKLNNQGQEIATK